MENCIANKILHWQTVKTLQCENTDVYDNCSWCEQPCTAVSTVFTVNGFHFRHAAD